GVTVALVKSVPMDPVPAIAAGKDAELALVEACRRGEREAQHAFYEKYRRRVFSLIARIVGAQDAEELVQEVFLRAYRGLDKFRGDAQLSTWMYRLAVNAALSHATRTQARQRRDLGEDALVALPAGYRAVLVLHDVEGLQHEEIAEILGCRVGTSKSQLHKARAKM